MILGQVFEGIGLGAWGAGFYALSRWYVRDGKRLRRMAQSRWWLDRWMIAQVRRGQMSQEQWFDRFAKLQRWTVRWAFTPVFVLWAAICAATIIHGMISHP
jgi:hypothetical protein